MNNNQSSKNFDLEERTFQFALNVRKFIKKLPKTICNLEDCKQLARASGSIGANYIEANESLGKKDFFHKMRISRKESKECRYWLRLVDLGENLQLDKERGELIDEASQFILIFSSIIKRSDK